MKPGDSGEYWYINEKGGFVSTYNFSDWEPEIDVVIPRKSAEIVELKRLERQDLSKLPRVA